MNQCHTYPVLVELWRLKVEEGVGYDEEMIVYW